MWDFIDERRHEIIYSAFQHAYLVVLAVAIATVIAVVLAIAVTRIPRLAGLANVVSAVGLTIPSFALVGLLMAWSGIGPTTALICVTFYAVFPVLRNAVVGLRAVDPTLLESARGMGMGTLAVMARVQLPLAWPVILAGIRVSLQMSMGVAAIAAIALGPGLGVYIFTGISQLGGKNALPSVVVGTVLIVILALILDLILLLLGRTMTSKGIRVSR